MGDNYFQNERKQRIKSLEENLEENAPVSKKKLVAEASIQFGVSTDTVEGYLDTLLDAERAKITDDNMVLVAE